MFIVDILVVKSHWRGEDVTSRAATEGSASRCGVCGQRKFVRGDAIDPTALMLFRAHKAQGQTVIDERQVHHCADTTVQATTGGV